MSRAASPERLQFDRVRDLRHCAHCLGCGYALCGLIENRCPECGRSFNPFDPKTMRLPGRPTPARPIPFAVEIVTYATVATAASAAGLLAPLWPVCMLGVAFWAIVFTSWRRRNRAERVAASRGETLPGTRHWRRVVTAMFALTLLSGIGTHQCPHGSYYRYGPVTVFHDRGNGAGPCRIYVHGTRFELAGRWYLIVS
jgi:hypothetical protein